MVLGNYYIDMILSSSLHRFATLKKWKETWDREATYKNLIECFLKIGKTQWADFVCELLPDVDAVPSSKLCY